MLRGLTLTAALCAVAHAQSTVYRESGRLPGDKLGTAVSGVGDVDGDGTADFLIGASRSQTGGLELGQVTLYSGALGTVLRHQPGVQDGAGFGHDVTSIADQNGDGVREIVVSAPWFKKAGMVFGRVFVFSGADGALLRTFDGTEPGGLFGLAVSGAGDADGDLAEDVAVGIPLSGASGAESGRVRVFSVARGGVIHDLPGASAGDRFGFSLAGVGDLDGDGTDDLAVGAPGTDSNGSEAGRVVVLSGDDLSVLLSASGDGAGAQLGFSVAAAGLVDGDAVPDLIAGADEDGTNGSKAGLARIFSGATGAVVRTFLGDDAGDRLGRSVVGLGDVDGDGRDDQAVGVLRDDDGGLDAGAVVVFSGLDGSLLARIDGDVGDELGAVVCGPGDVNGDGVPELLVGARFHDVGALADAGEARLVSPVTMPLEASIHELSLAAGGSKVMTIRPGAQHAGSVYWTLGSVSGTTPGIPDLAGMHLPLNYDFYMMMTFGQLSNPIFQHFLGFLDANGEASASFVLPSGTDPSLAGIVLHHAYVVAATADAADLISNPVPLTLRP